MVAVADAVGDLLGFRTRHLATTNHITNTTPHGQECARCGQATSPAPHAGPTCERLIFVS
jgi:hypothetical protein